MPGDIKVNIKKLDGLTLAGKGGSGHWTVMDTSKAVGGNEAATSPFELMFFALGGCMSMDMLSILKKKRNNVQDYEVNIVAKRREEYPQIAELIEMEFVFWGEVKAEDVERAIELSSTKYCGVSNMIKDEVIIKHMYKINP